MTGETCTGTGDVLTLTGPLAGHNAFGKTGNAEDGGLYSCVVEDANGTTVVAGVYTFDKTANTLTRNDSWNSTASAVDKNPSTNIALSGGAHTIICDVVSRDLSITPLQPAKWLMNGGGYDTPDNWNGSDSTNNVVSANECRYLGIRLNRARIISSITVNIVAGDALATISKAGFYSVGADGKPDKLLCSVSIDVTTTGIKSTALASPISLPAGDYYTAFATDGAPTVKAGVGGSFSATSYANTFLVPRNYHPKETLVGWSDLPSSPNPTTFTENYPAIVAWT